MTSPPTAVANFSSPAPPSPSLTSATSDRVIARRRGSEQSLLAYPKCPCALALAGGTARGEERPLRGLAHSRGRPPVGRGRERMRVQRPHGHHCDPCLRNHQAEQRTLNVFMVSGPPRPLPWIGAIVAAWCVARASAHKLAPHPVCLPADCELQWEIGHGVLTSQEDSWATPDLSTGGIRPDRPRGDTSRRTRTAGSTAACLPNSPREGALGVTRALGAAVCATVLTGGRILTSGHQRSNVTAAWACSCCFLPHGPGGGAAGKPGHTKEPEGSRPR